MILKTNPKQFYERLGFKPLREKTRGLIPMYKDVEKNKIDFAVYDYKKSKAGKIYSTITSQK